MHEVSDEGLGTTLLNSSEEGELEGEGPPHSTNCGALANGDTRVARMNQKRIRILFVMVQNGLEPRWLRNLI